MIFIRGNYSIIKPILYTLQPAVSFKTQLLTKRGTINKLTKIKNTTQHSLLKQLYWGKHTMFYKVMVIRGIGYRVFYIKNDFIIEQDDNMHKIKPKLIQNQIYTKNLTHPEFADFDESYFGWNNLINELNYNRYLVVRAGHTSDLYIPLIQNVNVKTFKKDRKLVIFGSNKQLIYNIARQVYEYRKPSIYTGRGVRRKHIKVVRKAGKRDKGR